jgi:hypothetical protein
MKKKKLKEGQEITVSIPFTYTVGQEGYYTSKKILTIQDAEDEVKAEIKAGVLVDNEVYFEHSY